MAEPLILVTNDDGIQAPGIAILAEAMSEVGEVWVFAPDREQSAVSHRVTLHRPLRVRELKTRWFMIDGTPTDCVMLAVRDLLPRRPALVASGVNAGANLGDDITYSGTVAGAYEGMLQGLPAMAVSDVAYVPEHQATAGRVAIDVARRLLAHGLPPDTMINVNVPDVPADELTGYHVTRMGRRHYEEEVVRRVDPRGGDYYWIGGALPGHHDEPGTDFEAIAAMAVSVTPLQRDMTCQAAMDGLQRWGWNE